MGNFRRLQDGNFLSAASALLHRKALGGAVNRHGVIRNDRDLCTGYRNRCFWRNVRHLVMTWSRIESAWTMSAPSPGLIFVPPTSIDI